MRQRSKSHLDFIRSLPCILCGNPIETEAAHVRMADGSIAKPITGVAIKPDDRYTIPLCSGHHRAQHSASERDFWKIFNIDPVKVALALYAVSGDYEEGYRIAKANRF